MPDKAEANGFLGKLQLGLRKGELNGLKQTVLTPLFQTCNSEAIMPTPSEHTFSQGVFLLQGNICLKLWPVFLSTHNSLS